MKIECLGSLPKNEDYANIYILAMRECLTNGVCHAGATELFITMQENNDFYRIRITNNGVAPEKEVVPKGGLYNLSRHIFDHGGEMQIQSIPYFALTITFQKKERKNEESIFPDKTPSVKLGLADSSELTAKEIEVLRFVCEGLEYSEIAERMHISQRTVKFHISNILSKTGYANKTRLAIAVTNKNFIIPSSPEKYM